MKLLHINLTLATIMEYIIKRLLSIGSVLFIHSCSLMPEEKEVVRWDSYPAKCVVVPDQYAFSDCSSLFSSRNPSYFADYYSNYTSFYSQDKDAIMASDNDIVLCLSDVPFKSTARIENGWIDGLSLCENFDQAIAGEGIEYSLVKYNLPNNDKVFTRPSVLYYSNDRLLDLSILRGSVDVTDYYCVMGQLEGLDCPVFSNLLGRSVLLSRQSSIKELLMLDPMCPGSLRLSQRKDLPESLKDTSISIYFVIERYMGSANETLLLTNLL